MSAPASTQFPSLESALKHFFGYDEFRLDQRAVIETFLNHQDCLVVMPTGGGKSLCYQLPSLLRLGIMVVVSPLIALMQDQVDALRNNGIAATFLNSSLNLADVRERERQLLAGEIKLLYVAPERLLSEGFWPFLSRLHQQVGISGFAIDEAHCVSEWGHDFRPEYRQLHQLRTSFPQVPMMALTATATTRVREDICQQLALQTPATFVASFNRPNLYYEVLPKDRQAYAHLLRHIKALTGAAIVYCLSRKHVEELASRLQQDGVAALPYHAGLSDDTRSEHQNRFIRDDVQVMVATIAFGMGINKPDVRLVAHYDLPRTLESYYQESGRAGRDGEPAHCTVYFGYGDVSLINYIIEQKADEQEQQIARQQLRQVLDYAESTVCRRQIQLSYFGEMFPGQCDRCDNCRYPKPLEDWTIEAQKFLSCVARCRERFGMVHIIDVLRGSQKKRILELQHDQLSTYGIGKDRSTEEWKLLGRSLLHQGLVEETTDGFPVLKLNGASWQVLRKQLVVQIAIPDTLKGGSEDSVETSAEAAGLLAQLRSLRKRLADAQGIPPYIVFTESTLRQMAQRMPRSLTQFSRISGVGSRKLEQYGQDFVTAINAYCVEHGVQSPAAQPQRASAPTSTQTQTLELYQAGHSLDEIARLRNLRHSTIVGHLVALLATGAPVNLDDLVPTDRQVAIRQALETVDSPYLNAVRDHLGDTYSYDEIRLVQGALRHLSDAS
ncbi:DNA helicase RecQ [Leptolyngbya iicbica]|uniref:DNA helicase RecQ n=2 Tax=Cyanophyceae TaxID=3028117 RepID=A0A4Q7E5S6_9CYAN|nr:DNA helicase RecQ [Leptolyngbya sp. LK]RZM77310.1 DNA helicase RecQ [Leptolyngbya sp. LK]